MEVGVLQHKNTSSKERSVPLGGVGWCCGKSALSGPGDI